MGKRKRTPPHVSTPSPSCAPSDISCSFGMDFSQKERMQNPSHSFARNLQDTQFSLPLPQPNYIHSTHLKRSRRYYGKQYSRRNPGSHIHASTSHGKGTPANDDKLIFKLPNQLKPDHGISEDFQQKIFSRPERIRPSSFVNDSAIDVAKMMCGICQRGFRLKPLSLGDGSSSTDVSVVAVLACGHVYHADCLDQRTCHEAICDPPCPLCLNPPAKIGIVMK